MGLHSEQEAMRRGNGWGGWGAEYATVAHRHSTLPAVVAHSIEFPREECDFACYVGVHESQEFVQTFGPTLTAASSNTVFIHGVHARSTSHLEPRGLDPRALVPIPELSFRSQRSRSDPRAFVPNQDLSIGAIPDIRSRKQTCYQ